MVPRDPATIPKEFVMPRPNPQAIDESQAAARPKRPYSPPALTVFGSVRELTGGNTGGFVDAGGMRSAPSDLAVKENVARVGEHALGFGLYLFDYKPGFRDAFGHGRQFGVVAQEVEAIVPDAVSFGEDGYRRVDYARLGIVRH